MAKIITHGLADKSLRVDLHASLFCLASKSGIYSILCIPRLKSNINL